MSVKATIASLTVVFCAALLAPKISMPASNGAYEIAKQGFVYGLPIVMQYRAMYASAVDSNSGRFTASFNQIHHDTLNSTAWLDLRAEPVVLCVPAVMDRLYSVQLTDGNTFRFGDVGSRVTGTDAGDYLIAGPDWSGDTPPGIKKVFWSTTQFPVAVFRTQRLNAADTDDVKRVQRGYRVQPLSAFLNRPAPPPAPRVEFPAIDTALAQARFFEYLDFALQFAPAGPEEKNIRAQLARIGVGPGKTMLLDDLSAEQKADIARAMKDAERDIDHAVANIGKTTDGWKAGSPLGDRAFYQGNWLLRAAVAKAQSRSAQRPGTAVAPPSRLAPLSTLTEIYALPARRLDVANASRARVARRTPRDVVSRSQRARADARQRPR